MLRRLASTRSDRDDPGRSLAAVYPVWIHPGKVIDIIGVRRIMLAFSAIGIALSLLYPVFRNVGALIVLQLIMK
jgi:hypothetical protein